MPGNSSNKFEEQFMHESYDILLNKSKTKYTAHSH